MLQSYRNLYFKERFKFVRHWICKTNNSNRGQRTIRAILMLIPKNKPIRNPKHLNFIRSLPCVVCWLPPRSQAAHVSKGNWKATGMKVGDDNTLPMCFKCHHESHQKGELKFWYLFGGYERAGVLARVLYAITGDELKAKEEMRKWNKRTS